MGAGSGVDQHIVLYKVAAKACKYLEDVALVEGEHNHRHSYHLCHSSGSRWLVGNTILDRR